MSGQVLPSGWTRANIRRFATMKSGHTPSRNNTAYWNDTHIPWFTLADVWQLRDGKQVYLGETSGKISDLGLAHSAAELLPAGTVVLSRTASVGFSGVMPKPMATSQDFWNWVCGPALLPEYLNYQFKSMTREFKALNMGSTHKTIYQKDAAGLHVIVPPLEAQRAIVAYLDRETARIDALIAKQEQLIATLRERRYSVLDELTTSIVAEWLPLKRLFAPSTDANKPGEQVLSVYRDYGVIPKSSRTDNFNRTPENLERYLLVRAGDLVVNRMKAWQGSLGVSTHRGVVSGDYEVLRPMGDRLDPKFAHLYLRSPRMIGQYAVRSTGIRPSQWRLYWGEMGNIEIPLPTLKDQRAVVAGVETQTAKIDLLIEKAERFIDLSKERRSALITAVVTGQLPVATAMSE